MLNCTALLQHLKVIVKNSKKIKCRTFKSFTGALVYEG